MSFCLRSLLAVVVGATAVFAQDVRRGFEPGTVHQIHLTLTAEEFAAIQPRGGGGFPGFGPPRPTTPAPALDPGREVHRNTFGTDLPWGTGTIRIGDEEFSEVGVRYKGNGTIADASRTVKKSLKIDLGRRGKAVRWNGIKTLNLHCGVTDPSKCRETLGYGLYRAAGVPAPQTAAAEVFLTVPGKFERELLGLYTVLEEVDKPFLQTHFGGDGGVLMKPEGVRDFDDRGDDWEKYQKSYDAKPVPSAEQAARLIAFARLVQKADDATFAKEIESYLEVENYLRFLAATAFVANTDSFFAGGHNYLLYLDSATGKLNFLPWDLDRAFANFGNSGPMMDLNMRQPYGGKHRLTERLFALPGMKERYTKLLEELARTAFSPENLRKSLAAAEEVIREPLARDIAAAAARKETAAGPGFFGKPPALNVFIEKRTESLAKQLAGTSTGHTPTGGFFGPPPKVGDMLGEPLKQTLDTDRDGAASKDEWLALAKKLFEAGEKDDSGATTEKQLIEAVNSQFPKPAEGAPVPPPQFRPGNFLAPPIMRRADADKNGRLTQDELLAAAEKIFDEFDSRRAGKLEDKAFRELLNALFPQPQGPPRGGPAVPR